MIESTSSWTNASGSKPNLLTAYSVADLRNCAPGASVRCASHACRRPAIPGACGMPARPASLRIVRAHSSTANCPSRKKPSRGLVAIQFGFPRPALRKALVAEVEAFFARSINSSLISNGLSFSKSRSLMASIASLPSNFVLRSRSRQQQDDHQAEDGQQRVADRVGHAVAERGNLALGRFLDHAEGGCRGAHARAGAQQYRGMELEDVVADVDRDDQRNGGRHDAP